MLSQSSIYAIRAVIAVADAKDRNYLGAKDISKQISAPPNYMGKLLQQLTRAGILASRKGLGGGVTIARPLKNISLWDIVNIIDSVKKFDQCLLGNRNCSDGNSCIVHSRWENLQKHYISFLKETTLENLLHKERHPSTLKLRRK